MRPLAFSLSVLLAAPLLFAQGVDMRARIETFSADMRDLGRRYDVPMSAERRSRLTTRLGDEAKQLAAIDFDSLSHDARIDWLLLDNHVRRELEQLAEEGRDDGEVEELVPFAATIAGLCEARRRMEEVDPTAAAETMATLAQAIDRVRTGLREKEFEHLDLPVAARAVDRIGDLRSALRSWFEYRDGYDPLFSWWVRARTRPPTLRSVRCTTSSKRATASSRATARSSGTRSVKRRCCASSRSSGSRTPQPSSSRSPSASSRGATPRWRRQRRN
jgi:hypothetical protein